MKQRLNSPSPSVAAPRRRHRMFQTCHASLDLLVKDTWGRVLLHRNGLLKTYRTFSGTQSWSCGVNTYISFWFLLFNLIIAHTSLIASDLMGAMDRQFGLKSACSLDCCNTAAIPFLGSQSEDRTLCGVIYMGSTHNRCWAEKKQCQTSRQFFNPDLHYILKIYGPIYELLTTYFLTLNPQDLNQSISRHESDIARSKARSRSERLFSAHWWWRAGAQP